MNNFINVMVIAEGRTEKNFIESLLSPYLQHKGINMKATLVSKPGQNGGDVKFSRVKKDIVKFLKQGYYTRVTTFVDYYGIREWPGLKHIPDNPAPKQIAECVNNAARKEVQKAFPKEINRFIPYMAVHEFEALLFSDCSVIADILGVKKGIKICGKPEEINKGHQTSPSKRLENWSPGFKKTITGIEIAKQIGIEKMRCKCPLFNQWIEELEKIQSIKQENNT